MIEAFLSALGLNKASVIAGGLGAAAAAVSGDSRPVWQRVVNFTVGFCVAAWGAGAAVSGFGLPDTPNFNGAFGFALGYLGMTIMDAAMAAAKSVRRADWAGIVDSWLRHK